MKLLTVSELKSMLQEQITLAKSQTTLGGFGNVMYGFVEIIESDPVFRKFIRTKIDQEVKLRNIIYAEYKAKRIDHDTEMRAHSIHTSGAFWHDHYCLFKQQHDVIKIDKCDTLGIPADYIDSTQIFLYSLDERDYNKRLPDEMLKYKIKEFEDCYNIIVSMLNSDRKLLEDIEKEIISSTQKENTNEPEIAKEKLEVAHNPNGQLCVVKYADEKIVFSGRRGLILSFFFKNKDGEKTYHDFNAWLKNSNIKDSEIDSQMFRQEIPEINERLAKESKHLLGLIKLVGNDQKNPTKPNVYIFKILLKKKSK